MCEAGYDLKLLLKNEENIITETKWGKSEADRCPYAWEKLYIPYFLQIVKERIEGGANEKAVLRLFINCPFVCINFDFFWLNKARQLYMDF